MDAELVLVGEDDLELEPRQAEERGDADKPAKDVLDTAAARRAAGGKDLALVREPDNPSPYRHRRDKAYRMVLREQPKAQGVRIGRPTAMPRAVVARMRRERAKGLSYAAIADKLNAAGVPTAQGGRRWYPATVRYALAEHSSKR